MFMSCEDGNALQCQRHHIEVCDMKLVDQNFVLANRNRDGWYGAYHLNPRPAFSRERCGKQSQSNGKNKGRPRQTKPTLNRFFHVEGFVPKPCLLGLLAEFAYTTGQYGY